MPLRELSTFTHCSDESSIRGQSDAFFSFDYIPTHTARQTCPRSFTLQRRGAYVCNILISRWLNGFFFFGLRFSVSCHGCTGGDEEMGMGTACCLLLLFI